MIIHENHNDYKPGQIAYNHNQGYWQLLQKKYRSLKTETISIGFVCLEKPLFLPQKINFGWFQNQHLKKWFLSIPEWNRSDIFNKAAYTISSGLKQIIQITECIHS